MEKRAAMPPGMILPDPAHPGPAFRGARPVGRAPPASGWRLLMAGYVGYAMLTLLDEAAGGGRSAVGAVLFLAVVAVVSIRRLFPVPLNAWTLALAFSILIPVGTLLSGLALMREGAGTYLVKYLALLVVLPAAAALRLPPLCRAPERWWGMGAVMVVLLIGLALGGVEDRVAGSFANPNNFALAAMSLLFFVDAVRDKRRFIIGVYGLVLVLILVSGTAGALAGYLAGVAYALLQTRFARLVGAALVAGLLAGTILLATLRTLDPEVIGEVRFIGPLWTKAHVAQQHFADVAAGDDLNYWELGQAYGGAELTSALWRMAHWRRTLMVFRDARLANQLFGQGIGSSEYHLDKLPHNDYLRLLFETGLLGLAANLVVWILPGRRLAPGARGPAVMMAVYALTENNLDNFLVMSLFALFLVSTAGAGFRGARMPEARP